MNIINETGVPTKYPGDGLSHQEVNAINSTVNLTVEAANYLLKNICYINAELENYNMKFDLITALNYVPVGRRGPGMTIKFINLTGKITESNYSGLDATDVNWLNLENWSDSELPDRIDGGEW